MLRNPVGYCALFVSPFAVQATLAVGLPDFAVAESPTALFVLVVVAAGLCVVASVLVLLLAFRTDAAELGWLGIFFFSASILPFVHGLTTPGVLYGPNDATMTSVILAVPMGLFALAPSTLPPRSPLARRMQLKWRGWVLGWVAALVIFSTLLLALPDLLPIPDMRSPFGLLAIGGALGSLAMLGWRHVELAEIADSRGPLIVSAGYALVGGSTAVLLGSTPYSAGFWVAHGLDIVGVFAATIGALVVYRRKGSMTQVLAPVVAVDPIAALEVGMDPEVRAFVTEIDAKDALTRDHVLRTAELAITVAAEMGLTPEEQRRCGLVGVLHDIGKLRVPDEILTKPGALDDDEWEIMRSHAAIGGDIAAARPSLADLAPAIRSHHERLDGRGYPDGLVADEIPIEAQVVSACDAYDAMAFTRHYRKGRSVGDVIATLKEHAGTQWDPIVVAALVRVVQAQPPTVPTLLPRETVTQAHDMLYDCVPATAGAAS
ncbi:MAG: HD-GYP domain-containing protein [Actinomycetota bacterium]